MYDVFGLFAKTQATNRSIPLTLADDHPVLNSIAKAFDDRITSSFKFVIDGHPIHVHKEYLTIRCEPLRALLEINNSENTITDYSYEAFKAFLRYLYTNDVFVAPDIAVELLGLADTYAETDLKRKCTQLISNGITVENVSLIYGAAVKHKEPTLQDICFKYAAKGVIKVVGGESHVCALTSVGEVYVWGDNMDSQLGTGNTTSSPIPLKMSFNLNNEKIVDIECGLRHTLALTDAGHVYAWGYNGHGQLGNGNFRNQSTHIKVIGVLEKYHVTSIVCGGYHSLAVTDTGSVFGWGYGGQGQLGMSNTTYKSEPVQIKYFKDMRVAKTTYRSIPMNTADDNHPVLNSMTDAFDNTISSNFRFVIDGQPIHVIKEYLIIRCKSMEPMICLLDTNQTEVVITDYSYEAFKAFLRYLYTNDVFVAPDIAVELLGLANTYAETDLKRKCTQLIRNGITVENVALIYGAAVKYKEPTLQDICFKYAALSDIGYYDDKECIFITGRVKKSGAHSGQHFINISPVEIEQHLLTHPSIAKVAVLALYY
ncbi:unnamed protein product [Medioppia subpectinata]|uniref:BTB domain-containing protein n=1 Tax=Medioppia subpectinata TaxID=1979941 RepID=A0A7R9KE90_9ACAR|nr:unnamed protein product [Medioppia subpectinata]CAG2100698.1 unnamed protein product [Medioppia subpectinata]